MNLNLITNTHPIDSKAYQIALAILRNNAERASYLKKLNREVNYSQFESKIPEFIAPRKKKEPLNWRMFLA